MYCSILCCTIHISLLSKCQNQTKYCGKMSECVENTHRVNSVLRLAYTRKMRIIMNTKTMTIEEDSKSKLAGWILTTNCSFKCMNVLRHTKNSNFRGHEIVKQFWFSLFLCFPSYTANMHLQRPQTKKTVSSFVSVM